MVSSAVARVQTDDRNINQLQANIIPPLNILLQNALLGGTILKSQVLAIGNNFIATTLGATLQGWIIVRKRGGANIYDNQDIAASLGVSTSNTLVLNSDTAVTVDIYVF